MSIIFVDQSMKQISIKLFQDVTHHVSTYIQTTHWLSVVNSTRFVLSNVFVVYEEDGTYGNIVINLIILKNFSSQIPNHDFLMHFEPNYWTTQSQSGCDLTWSSETIE